MTDQGQGKTDLLGRSEGQTSPPEQRPFSESALFELPPEVRSELQTFGLVMTRGALHLARRPSRAADLAEALTALAADLCRLSTMARAWAMSSEDSGLQPLAHLAADRLDDLSRQLSEGLARAGRAE